MVRMRIDAGSVLYATPMLRAATPVSRAFVSRIFVSCMVCIVRPGVGTARFQIWPRRLELLSLSTVQTDCSLSHMRSWRLCPF